MADADPVVAAVGAKAAGLGSAKPTPGWDAASAGHDVVPAAWEGGANAPNGRATEALLAAACPPKAVPPKAVVAGNGAELEGWLKMLAAAADDCCGGDMLKDGVPKGCPSRPEAEA